ncbi:MAG: hypothetical protein OEM15_18345 [Myxococcales bacterium]|nr:hypothetical protein [Myxococcales bacterium]MDH3486011.1 hypothetical protein [Myxococcales bacterium]
MISDDFAFFGFDDVSWGRLVSLLLGERGAATSKPRGALVVVVDEGGAPVAAFHTAQGSIDPASLPPLDDLGAFCDATAAGACIVMRKRAMPGLARYLADPLDTEQDFVARVMRFARVLRELGNGNLLRVWPNPLPDVFLPAAPSAKPAGDVLLPDDHSAILGVFDGAELWTGAVLRRHRGSFDTLAGPQAMSQWTGPLGGAWRRDHRVVVQAVERELGPVHVGLFLELPTARAIFKERQPGAWALAYASRSLIIYPLPGFAAAALGINGLVGLAQAAFQAIEEMDPDEVARIAEGFWRGLTDGEGITGLLGFSPVEVISEVWQEKVSQRPGLSDSEAPDEATDDEED